MTQEIKQFRRIVTEERIVNAAKEIWVHHLGYPSDDFDKRSIWDIEKEACMQQAIIALRTDAEVIQGIVFDYMNSNLILQTHPMKGMGTKHFLDEWEEIT